MFSDQDLAQIAARGSALATVETQINNFETGFPFLQVKKAATVGDGIIRLTEQGVAQYVHIFSERLADKKILKFVPASGAASRMFKALFAAMAALKAEETNVAALQEANSPVAQVLDRIKDFAAYSDLNTAAQSGGHTSIEALLQKGDAGTLLELLLTEAGLRYGKLPKGLLKFHTYQSGARTPFEEHLVEAANYAAAPGGVAYVHMTVSPEHRQLFENLLGEVQETYEKAYGVSFDVSFSEQKAATDTIAVDMDNHPFRNGDGSLLFRPAGHGALIENLNEMDADVIFIKNIDNVVPDRLKGETYRFKKALAGLLLAYQEKIFAYLTALDGPNPPLAEIDTFLRETMSVLPPANFEQQDTAEQMAYYRGKLDRPIRVCGMVKNEGEPGGGPFWALNQDGTVSLQIAETAQIDKNDAQQHSIMQHATHFNPVDLICGTKDHNGASFDLLKFRDPRTGFIAFKSKDGRELKAQELPGLWNGAMANWNTLFVEVPIETFNPVKTFNDLLREQHQ